MFQASHTGHHTQNVVIHGIHANLGSVSSLNGGVGKNQLQSSVINTRKVARAGRLVFLGSQRERIQVDTGIRGASVVLPRLNEVEVSSFALREAILAVKLELGSDDWVLTPAVHVERSLGEDKGAGIRDTGGDTGRSAEVGEVVSASSAGVSPVPPRSAGGIDILCASVGEEARSADVRTSAVGDSVVGAEGHNGVGEGIHCVGVVEGLGAEKAVENGAFLERRAVVNVLVGLDDPDELLNGVVEVELDLVGGRADGLITGELKLLDEVLVGVLGHTSALIGVQEDVVNVEGSGDEGLVVGGSDLSGRGVVKAGHGPQALLNGADIKVDLDLVVLKGDGGEGQTGVAAEPELEGDIKGGLGESIAGGANLARSVALTRTVNIIERRIGDKGEFGGVSDHTIITASLIDGQSEVVPDVHPVTVLAINALTTDFDFNLRNKLFTGEIEPTGIHCGTGGIVLHILVDFRKSNLKVSAVCKITVAANSASYTATEIGLSIKSLFNGFHSKVSVTFV